MSRLPKKFFVCFVLTFSKSLLIYTFEKYSLKYFVTNNLIHLSLICTLLIPKGILSGKELITFYFNDISNFMPFSYELDIFFPPNAFYSFLGKRSHTFLCGSQQSNTSHSWEYPLRYTYRSAFLKDL